MTSFLGLAGLEQIESPFLNAWTASVTEEAAVMLHLLRAHMASTSKQVMLAMVLDLLDKGKSRNQVPD